MEWHDVQNPQGAELDRLAERYQLHALHIEDCRHGGQNAKIEEQAHYLFVVLKPVEVGPDGSLGFSDLDLFVGHNFLITVWESDCAAARRAREILRPAPERRRPGRLLYQVTDAIVDSYLPVLDHLEETSDSLQEEVLQNPSPAALDRIFHVKRNLIELRRVLANTRDVMSHLQRTQSDLIQKDLWPFLRDIYDHVARAIDTVDVLRDILGEALEIYLSSVSQRTNQVVKVLTILGTITLPALLVTSAAGVICLLTAVLAALLRLFRWI
jgi:magnesium transporter